jgi:hypothetical protein
MNTTMARAQRRIELAITYVWRCALEAVSRQSARNRDRFVLRPRAGVVEPTTAASIQNN